jgi:hypothetical protein
MVRDVLEVRTTLGDTLLELAVIDHAMQLGELRAVATPDGYALRSPDGAQVEVRRGTTVQLRRGRGAIAATIVERPARSVPRPRVELRVPVYLGLSLALHLGLLAAGRDDPGEAAPASSRPRLMARTASAPRARQAADVAPSVHDDDAAAGQLPAIAMALSADDGEPAPDVPADGTGDADRTHATPRDPEPCTGTDCGLIASGPYSTRGDGYHAGAEYDLAPRQPYELALSVVACTVDGGCTTTSGTDQQDIRAALAHHVAELHACFANGSAATASIELSIDDGGGVHVKARDGDAIATCLSSVIGKLSLPGGARDHVTLAFARD